jgi:hypothetical protein
VDLDVLEDLVLGDHVGGVVVYCNCGAADSISVFFFGWVIETYSPELVVKTEERLRPPSLPSKMSGLKGELARRVLRRRPFFVDARRIITAFTLAE